MGSKSSKVSEKPKGNVREKLELEEVGKWETTEDEEKPKDSENEDCAENDSIDNPEVVENESGNFEESESRVTTGTEVDQSENGSDTDGVTTSETEDDDDDSPEEYNSRSSSDQNEEEHEELVSTLEDYVAENGISQETAETNDLVSESQERIATGADVAVYQYEQNLADFVVENPSSVEEVSEDEIQLLDSSYPVQSEKRQNGMILIEVAGPRADQIQQFWQMVVEKRIPTIHMTCDYVEDGVLKCAPYNPILGESEVKCGIFIIKRLGTEAQLSMNLKRQQLLIYETKKSLNKGAILEYKHSVTHFQEIENDDHIQRSRNLDVINKHVSHQPNPQLLVHGS
ncbi:hypothetical protein L5515_001947 [Caenorhabditis briggsae]|uniref:Tyrosine-protein phosphatase domain-containing protein n=1 Tax=Caenorhabditis briggsae TaxID=6238 RepID=A0AAE9J4X3_CAEBR|nr:hypothetical protein L5515_001947 [Caenorhabditis briggsae]